MGREEGRRPDSAPRSCAGRRALGHGNLSTTSLVYRRNKMPEWYRRRRLNLLKEDKKQILVKGMIQGKIRTMF